MTYVDSFMMAVPKAALETYKSAAREAGEIWMSLGALSYVECIGDDVPYGTVTSYPRAVQAKDDEVVILSWVVYADRAARDAISKKVMSDPRIQGVMGKMAKEAGVDLNRMMFGGFAPFVEL